MGVFTVSLQNFILLATAKVRYVCGNKCEVASKNLRSSCQAARGHSHFLDCVVLCLLCQRISQ